MQSKNLWILISIMIAALFGALEVNAQDMCVITGKNIAKFEGIVRQDDKQVIPNALIKIYKKNADSSEKLVGKVRTDAEGNFEVSRLADGKYIVRVSYPNFIPLVFPINIDKKKCSDCNKLVVILGWNYNETCGGGDVLAVHRR